MSTYSERWAMICEGMLGVPATEEQMTRFEDAVGVTKGMLPGEGPTWDELTEEEQSQACVDSAYTHFTGLVKSMDYNNAMRAAAESTTDVEDEFRQADPEATTAKRRKK